MTCTPFRIEDLPPKCRDCEHRENYHCKKHDWPIWRAWRHVNGCKVHERKQELRERRQLTILTFRDIIFMLRTDCTGRAFRVFGQLNTGIHASGVGYNDELRRAVCSKQTSQLLVGARRFVWGWMAGGRS
jgi:hypothetical protein